MEFLLVKLIHIFSVFIYAGFLFTDNLILMRMEKTLGEEKYKEVRGYFAKLTRAIVPKALVVAVASGIYLFFTVFGTFPSNYEFTTFQSLLLLKAFFGLWLGLRGVLQVFFGIQPFVFKGHTLPFVLTIAIIFLSQAMYSI